jgi:hypothetical protein
LKDILSEEGLSFTEVVKRAKKIAQRDQEMEYQKKVVEKKIVTTSYSATEEFPFKSFGGFYLWIFVYSYLFTALVG